MPLPWVIVGGTGYDVEEVLDPETRDMRCPSCEKHVRFVERQLVKNLRVFGVPLVGVERGRRVFECPHCKTCVERGEDDLPGARRAEGESREPVGGTRAATAALEQLLARAEDEVWLWKRRAETAERAGETQLAAEALELAVRAERERDRLRAELARGGRARGGSAGGSPPVVVARPAPGGGAVPVVDDEFAALKARLARRAAEAGAEAGAEDATAAGEQSGREPEHETPQGEEAPAQAGAVAEGEPPPADVEAEFAALKAKLRGGAAPAPADGAAPPAAGETDYEALKRELAGAAAEPAERDRTGDPREVPPAAPRGPGPEGRPASREPAGPGDPLADLKRKLRRG